MRSKSLTTSFVLAAILAACASARSDSPAKSLDYESPVGPLSHTAPLFVKQSKALIDLLRTQTPQQIADQIVFLCSPRGRTISGQAIAIDGDTQSLA